MTAKTLSDFLAVAADPSSSVARLVSLADAPQPEIHRALARNPNTPVDLLQHFWKSHPDCILNNPVITLWEFTRPGSAAELIGGNVLLLLYNHLRRRGDALPDTIFTQFTLVEMVRKAVSMHNPGVFEFVPKEESHSLRRLLVEKPTHRGLFRFFENHAPDEVWKRFATDPDPAIRLEFANLLRSSAFDAMQTREIAGTVTRLLLRDGRPEVLRHLANCRFLPSDLVEKFSFSPDVEIREALGRCVFAPASALERLARDAEEAVRVSIARHCENETIQRILMRDPSVIVRKRLAESSLLCGSLIHEFDLCDDPSIVRVVFLRADSKLRARILREALPEAQKGLLDLEKSLTPAFYRANKQAILPEILALLAQGVGTHPKIVEDLARDERPDVRLGVARRLSSKRHWKPSQRNILLVNQLAKDSDSRVRHEICTDWRLDAASTASLFADPDPVLRKKTLCAVLDFLIGERVGRRFENYTKLYLEKAPLIASLARDPDHAVRFAIASCKEAPPAAMGILFDDPEVFIRKAARAHEFFSFGVVIDLETALGSQPNNVSLREGTTTPSAHALRILSDSENPFIRKLVAHCKRTPVAELRKLACDPNPVVRQTANLRLSKA